MELTTLSNIELKRLEIIQSILDKHLSVIDAGEHLGLSRNQVHRLLKRRKSVGTAGLASGKRGKPTIANILISSGHAIMILDRDWSLRSLRKSINWALAPRGHINTNPLPRGTTLANHNLQATV